MSGGTTFTSLASEKYVSLTTFRRNGEAVRTPVWMAGDPSRPEVLYAFTGVSTGKVKRIRNNARVELAPCTMRGKVTGEAIPGVARILPPADVEVADRPLTRKYPLVKRLLDFRARKVLHRRIYLQIVPADVDDHCSPAPPSIRSKPAPVLPRATELEWEEARRLLK